MSSKIIKLARTTYDPFNLHCQIEWDNEIEKWVMTDETYEKITKILSNITENHLGVFEI